MRRNVKEPTVLYLFTNLLAESTELNRNIATTKTANAIRFIRNGEKSNIETIILYKGVLSLPIKNADFVMKVGNHNTIAITMMTICCAR